MDFENEIEKSPSNVYVPLLIKSIGEEDADGNYIFEVEASNENLDLQNQRIQQNALLKSKEYFITNGVISDDHQHKRYDKDGNVISDKSKIIGEPISVRTEGTSTFVKGKLYGNNDYALEYIKLLKAHSSRVKASVGGIMPTVRKNPDGTETVTAFRWNDLALTCSPVNYTVGSAVFAKSLSNVDFCKALMAGSGTDAAAMSGGRALQGEDLEGAATNVLPENRPNEISKTEENDIGAINELMAAISTGEIKTREEMEAFLLERGFDGEKARASVREIISQGGHTIMAKSVLEQTKNLLKALTGDASCGDGNEKDGKKKPDEQTPPENKGGEGSENGEGGNEGGEDGGKPEELAKSLPEGYAEATPLLEALVQEVKKSNEAVEALSKRFSDIEAQQGEVEKSVLEVAKSVGEFANAPLPKKSATSIQKSDIGGAAGGEKVFTDEDWGIAKSVLISAVKAKDISLEKSEALSSACQKALHGGQMSREVWLEMSALCNKYASK